MIGMYTGLLVVKETGKQFSLLLGLLVWPFLVWLSLVHFKWSFFSYRIVTNMRAALIIPQRRYPKKRMEMERKGRNKKKKKNKRRKIKKEKE